MFKDNWELKFITNYLQLKGILVAGFP